MAIKFAVQRLREKAQRLHREYEALCVFTNVLTTSARKRLEFEKEKLVKARRAELPKLVEQLKRAISETRRDWSFRVPNTEIVEILGKIESAPKGELLRMSKAGINQICTGYSKYSPPFDDLPAHTMIEFDPGILREKRGQINWFLLEASVFEDMCALFNSAKRIGETTNPQKEKIGYKTHSALLRATVLAAFHFVEAYLNGLAFDYYASQKEEISEDVKSILFDWDHKRQKPKYLSLRDKALQYPKIVLGIPSPPLREDNCSELKRVIESLEVRHRLTHISPKREFDRAAGGARSQFYMVDGESIEEIVDSCIGLVRRIEHLINGQTLRLHWLHDREADGMFPDAVFD